MRRVLVVLIRLYQLCLSPYVPPACRFQPTCSEYMVEAIRRFGALKGLRKGAMRLLRCHPFGRCGYDPVE